jgi:hypothetical protein
MTKAIILSQTQMDAIINASKQNSLETITLKQLCVGGGMYELLFKLHDNGYYYSVLGEGNTFTTKLDDKTYEAYMDIINNPVL